MLIIKKVSSCTILKDVVVLFSKVPDPDIPGHLILEQFQAQVSISIILCALECLDFSYRKYAVILYGYTGIHLLYCVFPEYLGRYSLKTGVCRQYSTGRDSNGL